MWIAEGWKDYELIDCSGGGKLGAGVAILSCGRPPGHLADAQARPALEGLRREIYPQRVRRRGLGQAPPAPELADRLRRAPLQREAHELQAHGHLPGAGRKLGLHHAEDTRRGARISVLNLFAYTGAATVAALRAGASVCHVDAAKGMVAWAKEETPPPRSGGQARPLDSGRLRQVRRARDTPRAALRRRHRGPAQLRARPRRRGLEARGQPLGLCQPGLGRPLGRPALRHHQFLHHGAFALGADLYQREASLLSASAAARRDRELGRPSPRRACARRQSRMPLGARGVTSRMQPIIRGGAPALQLPRGRTGDPARHRPRDRGGAASSPSWDTTARVNPPWQSS